MKKFIFLVLLVYVKQINAQICFNPPDSFAIGSKPSALVTADFDKDGKIDIAASNWSTNDVSIFLGTGTGSFGSATSFSIGSNPQDVIAADFDGDGNTDLATANHDSYNVSILLGTGTGIFSAPVNYAVGSNPYSVYSNDFNGDGIKDILVSAFSFGISHNFYLLTGTGSGTFNPASSVLSVPTNTTVLAFTCADFNGDSKIDLAITKPNWTDINVYMGTGTGSFGPATNYTVAGAYEIATSDINADTFNDLIICKRVSNNYSISIMKGDGAGNFSFSATYSVNRPSSPAFADYNSDGIIDLAIASAPYNNLNVMLGTGNGNFATPIIVAAIASPSDVITADFNGDTKPDLATNGYNVSVVINCNNVNIEVFSDNNEIKIYPNPANNSLQVTVGYGHVTDVKIYDLLGKQIKIEELKRINDAMQIDVSNLKEGVYFVDVKTSKEVLTKKLIIQR